MVVQRVAPPGGDWGCEGLVMKVLAGIKQKDLDDGKREMRIIVKGDTPSKSVIRLLSHIVLTIQRIYGSC